MSEAARLLVSLCTLIICSFASGHLTPILSNSNGFIGSGRGGGGGETTKTQRRFVGCRRCNNTVNDDFKWDNYGSVMKQGRV